MNKLLLNLFILITFSVSINCINAQNKSLIAFVENAADNSAISSVHVINLSQVIGVITDKAGKFEIQAQLNETL